MVIVAILLMAISSYFIDDYCDYFIDGYCGYFINGY
jgi:hypothetical protein